MTREGASTRRTKELSRELRHDETACDEIVPSATSSSFDGRTDDVMLLPPNAEKPTKALDGPMSRV